MKGTQPNGLPKAGRRSSAEQWSAYGCIGSQLERPGRALSRHALRLNECLLSACAHPKAALPLPTSLGRLALAKRRSAYRSHGRRLGRPIWAHSGRPRATTTSFIVGVTRGHCFAIQLEQLQKFQQEFVVGDEMREIFGGHQRTISCKLDKAGVKPVATFNGSRVWRHSDIERYVAFVDLAADRIKRESHLSVRNQIA